MNKENIKDNEVKKVKKNAEEVNSTKIDLDLYSKDPQEIIVETKRQRKAFSEKQIDTLAQSIKQLGQLQPGLCFKKGDQTILIAGERRLRACKKLEIPFTYTLTTLVDEGLRQQAQLEENLKRENLAWQEEVKAKKKLFELFKERNPATTIRTMAAHLGESKSLFNEDIQLASWVDEIPEVNLASNKTLAKKIVKRLTETIKRQDKLESLQKEHGRGTSKDPLKTSFEGTRSKLFSKASEDLENSLSSYSPPAITVDLNKIIKTTSLADERQEEKRQDFEYFTKHCLLGNFEDLASQLAPGIFDVVFFDPPWGVNYDEARPSKGAQKNYSDDEWDFKTKFHSWIATLYELMSPNSHLYCFFAITNHEFVYSTLETVGFQVDRIPLIWYKTGQHVTRTPKVSFGRSYEPIAFARKGNKPLRKLGFANHIETSKAPKILSDMHPTSKHPDIYKILLDCSVDVGDKIFDPMAGSGAMGLAAELRRKELETEWLMIEQAKEFNILQKTLLTDGYYKILRHSEELEAETNGGKNARD